MGRDDHSMAGQGFVICDVGVTEMVAVTESLPPDEWGPIGMAGQAMTEPGRQIG